MSKCSEACRDLKLVETIILLIVLDHSPGFLILKNDSMKSLRRVQACKVGTPKKVKSKSWNMKHLRGVEAPSAIGYELHLTNAVDRRVGSIPNSNLSMSMSKVLRVVGERSHIM